MHFEDVFKGDVMKEDVRVDVDVGVMVKVMNNGKSGIEVTIYALYIIKDES